MFNFGLIQAYFCHFFFFVLSKTIFNITESIIRIILYYFNHVNFIVYRIFTLYLTVLQIGIDYLQYHLLYYTVSNRILEWNIFTDILLCIYTVFNRILEWNIYRQSLAVHVEARAKDTGNINNIIVCCCYCWWLLFVVICTGYVYYTKYILHYHLLFLFVIDVTFISIGIMLQNYCYCVYYVFVIEVVVPIFF